MMFSIALNPNVEEWLSKVCNFEKFRFSRIAVTYESGVPTTATGQLIGWFQTDVDDPEIGGNDEESIKRAMACSTAAQVDIWTPHTWFKSFKGDNADWLYCGADYHDARLAYQGKFNLMAATDMTDATLPDVIGHLIITYEIQTMTPNISNGVNQGSQICYESGAATSIAPFASMHADSLWDTALSPDYQVPDGFDVKITNDTTLEPPVGYYSVDLFCVSTSNNAPAWSLTFGGGARYLYNGPSHNIGSNTLISNSNSCLYSALLAFPAGSTISATVTNGGNLSTVRVRFQSLGGAIPYSSSAAMMRYIVSSLNGGQTPKMTWFSPRPRYPSTLGRYASKRSSSSSSSSSSSNTPLPAKVPDAIDQGVGSRSSPPDNSQKSVAYNSPTDLSLRPVGPRNVVFRQ